MRASLLLPLMLVSASVLGGVRERQYPSGKEFFIRGWLTKYPFEARRAHEEGEGRFRLYIDKSGRVTSVKVLQSTGHALLDNAAVKAMMSWQAAPGLRRETEVPFTFTMSPAYSPVPRQPLVVREFTD